MKIAALVLLLLSSFNVAVLAGASSGLNDGIQCKQVLAFFALQTTTVDGEVYFTYFAECTG